MALAIAWGASLLLLLALALLADRTPAFSQTSLPGGIRRLAAFPRQFRTRDWLGGVAVLIVAVLAGLAVVVVPEVAIVLAVALTLGLFFAFVRKTFAEHARAFRQRVARPEGPAPDDPDDDAFAVPRRLYYGGVLLLGFLVLRAGGQATLSDLIFLASFGLASAEFVILRRRVPMTLPFVLLVGVGLFTLGGLLSTFESYEPLESMAVIVRLVFLMVVWFWLSTVVLRKQAYITRAIGFWCASAALAGGGAILRFLRRCHSRSEHRRGPSHRVRLPAQRPRRDDSDRVRAGAHARVPSPRLIRRTSLVVPVAAPHRSRDGSVRICRRYARRRRRGRPLAGPPANVASCLLALAILARPWSR